MSADPCRGRLWAAVDSICWDCGWYRAAPSPSPDGTGMRPPMGQHGFVDRTPRPAMHRNRVMRTIPVRGIASGEAEFQGTRKAIRNTDIESSPISPYFFPVRTVGSILYAGLGLAKVMRDPPMSRCGAWAQSEMGELVQLGGGVEGEQSGAKPRDTLRRRHCTRVGIGEIRTWCGHRPENGRFGGSSPILPRPCREAASNRSIPHRRADFPEFA